MADHICDKCLISPCVYRGLPDMRVCGHTRSPYPEVSVQEAEIVRLKAEVEGLTARVETVTRERDEQDRLRRNAGAAAVLAMDLKEKSEAEAVSLRRQIAAVAAGVRAAPDSEGGWWIDTDEWADARVARAIHGTTRRMRRKRRGPDGRCIGGTYSAEVRVGGARGVSRPSCGEALAAAADVLDRRCPGWQTQAGGVAGGEV